MISGVNFFGLCLHVVSAVTLTVIDSPRPLPQPNQKKKKSTKHFDMDSACSSVKFHYFHVCNLICLGLCH